ncbi:hypothetical protein OHS18_46675 [Amycolatopsis sp. NBC_00355]|uniref:hypothetical protein n=1 Tax=Amycolatopsis sp. NBC_00355 TaxID=2975957 RepID=UPI002E26748E
MTTEYRWSLVVLLVVVTLVALVSAVVVGRANRLRPADPGPGDRGLSTPTLPATAPRSWPAEAL